MNSILKCQTKTLATNPSAESLEVQHDNLCVSDSDDENLHGIESKLTFDRQHISLEGKTSKRANKKAMLDMTMQFSNVVIS